MQSQRVLSTNIGNTYPNHEGSYYYRNHTLYHISTLDPLGILDSRPGPLVVLDLPVASMQDRSKAEELANSTTGRHPCPASRAWKPVLDCLTSSCHGHVAAGDIPLNSEAADCKPWKPVNPEP